MNFWSQNWSAYYWLYGQSMPSHQYGDSSTLYSWLTAGKHCTDTRM